MNDGPRRTITRRSLMRLSAIAVAAGAAVGVTAWPGTGAARTRFHPGRAADRSTTTVPPGTAEAAAGAPGPTAVSARAARTPARSSAATAKAARRAEVVEPEEASRRRTPHWARDWTSPIYSTEDFNRHCPEQRRMPHDGIMLTIDDGPSPQWTPKFLRLLRDLDITATFSLIGEEVAEYPRLVHDIRYHGHQISNHTWTHPENLPYLSADRIHDEIAKTQRAIIKACGVRPHLFRAPGGVWGPAVYRELRKQQLMPLGWDIDPRDWSLPGVDSIESAMLAAGPRNIILCHDGGGDRAETYDALKYVLPRLKERRLRFVTLPYLPL